MGAPPPVTLPSCDVAETFEQFKQRLDLGKRSYLRRQAREILGVSDSSLERLIREGVIRPFVVGRQQQTFWGPDLTAVLWSRRAPPPTIAPVERKPRTDKQKTPPKLTAEQMKHRPRRGRGRPRTSPIHKLEA